MFPQWDDEAGDPRVDNIVKAMYGRLEGQSKKKVWIWEKDHWPALGVLPSYPKVKEEPTKGIKREAESVVGEDSVKKARLDASLESFEQRIIDALTVALDARMDQVESSMKEQFVDFGMRIQFLSHRIEQVASSIGVIGSGPTKKVAAASADGEEQDQENPRKDGGSAAKSTAPDGSSVNKGEAEPSVVLLDRKDPNVDYPKVKREKQSLQRKATDLIVKSAAEQVKRDQELKAAEPVQQGPEAARGLGYDPFGVINKADAEALTSFLRACPEFKSPKPKKDSTTYWYRTLRVPQRWLWDLQIDAAINLLRQRYHFHPQWFRSDRICFLDSSFTTLWRRGYADFESTADEKGLGRVLPAGALDLYTGDQPDFCKSNKVWGLHVDEIYTCLNINNAHWVALMISIPRRHIIVWDSIIGCVGPLLLEALKPITVMMGYVMHTLCHRDDQYKHPNEPYTYEIAPADQVPQAAGGDCGLYSLKYIECHALGMPFPRDLLCEKNVKHMRDKFAVEIYKELGVTGKEKRDYEGLDMYDERK